MRNCFLGIIIFVLGARLVGDFGWRPEGSVFLLTYATSSRVGTVTDSSIFVDWHHAKGLALDQPAVLVSLFFAVRRLLVFLFPVQ